MACWLCQWNGGLLSKVKLSFLRKLPMNSLVNSSDFVSNLSVMCSIQCICWITLMFLINSQEETWKGRGRRAAYGQLFCSKLLYSTECAIEMIQVITNTSSIHFMYCWNIYSSRLLLGAIIVLDLLDHQPQHRPISHFIFSREDWITDLWFHV
jgi:hypothetical protein